MMKKLLFCLLLISLTFLLISGTACGNEEISVGFDKTEYTLAVGESITLELQGNTKGEKIIWYTSNKSVVSVEDGKLTALSVGTAEIRATVSSGVASCIVNAVPNDNQQDNSDVVYSVRLNHNRLEIQPGNQAVLNASVYKNGSLSTETVEWIISDTAVLNKIINGNSITIDGAGIGNCDVIAKIGKATAICKVNVDYKYDFILEGDSAVLTVSGEPYQIVGKAYINGELDNTPAIQWISDNLAVASVNSNGLVTPVGIGKTTIKALYHGKESTFEIKVKQIVSISSKADFLAIGQPQSEFSNYVLTSDLVFSTADFTYNLKGDPDFMGFYETPKTGYLVRNLDSVFDGQGHTITTDYQKGTDAANTGSSSGFTVMFKEIGANGVLRNLKVVATTDSGWGASSVTKDNRGLIENCYITASHTYQYGWESWQCFYNTAEIIYNYGTVRNCVFNLYTYHNGEGATGLTNYAVRYTFAGGSIENCTVIGNSGHNISSNISNWDTAANSDDKRNNCYVFASVSDLLSGNGYKYNADGTVTAGTYADAKDLYAGTYWTAWGFVNYTVTFNTNGGNSIAATEYVCGTLTSTLPEATKSDSTFLYWTLSNGDPLPETITNDITVKAVWGIGTATTLNITNKADFLNMGTTLAGYHEKERPFISFALTTDLTLANADYTRVACEVGTESATWDRIAYLVESLNSVFDGQGHTISVTYNKDVLAGIDGKVEAYPALFHTISANGVLKNVKIVSYTLTNFETTSVARWNYGTVENCYIDATHILQHEASRLDYDYVTPQYLREWFQTNTGEIVANYGTVRNCVFKIMTSYIDGTEYKCSHAVRHTYEGGKFENCTVIGRDATYQFISTDYANLAHFGNNPALTFANKDAIRDNCYVFTSVSNLLSGNGGQYNADGTITAGTYADAKNLYTGTYWTAWLNS